MVPPPRLPTPSRWSRLPRDSRDTLFLLAVMAWTLAPHTFNVPWWCSTLAAVVLAWRARLAWAQAPLPSRRLLLGILLIALGATWLTHRGLLGRDAGVTLLVVLAALKSLELRARRDAFVMFFLGFFLILTQFVHTQSLPIALMMVVSIWGLLTGLVLAHMPVGQPALRSAATLAARTAMLGTPIMVALFVLFPRIGPLWGQPSEGLARTGLSQRLQLGDIAELAQDDTIAMRLKFPAAASLDPRRLYFRGPVLGDFDGMHWTGTPASAVEEPIQIRTTGMAIPYELTLEPHRGLTIPLLEATPSIPQIEGSTTRVRLSPSGDLQWKADQPVNERLRLRGWVWPQFHHGPLAANPGLQRYLVLPEQSNPRTQAWAAGIRLDPQYAQADASTLARALMQHIRAGDFRYTLSPGTYGHDAIDEFWLDRKAGFCEHYAASFVLIMRRLGIPARIVTGYQGAEHNSIDDTWVIRQRFAHAWAEYWQDGVGWLRADPTNAVAPERIERSETLMQDPGVVARTLGQVSPAVWPHIRSLWDATNHGWNQWVINYAAGSQTQLLQRLGFERVDLTLLLRLIAGIMVVAASSMAAWTFWQHHRQDPWLRAWRRILSTADQCGWVMPASTGPYALASRLRIDLGTCTQAIADDLAVFCAQRYGPNGAEGERPLWPRPATLARSICRQLRELPRRPESPSKSPDHAIAP